jgi:hypothetical protein
MQGFCGRGGMWCNLSVLYLGTLDKEGNWKYSVVMGAAVSYAAAVPDF